VRPSFAIRYSLSPFAVASFVRDPPCKLGLPHIATACIGQRSPHEQRWRGRVAQRKSTTLTS
jgi:hypothetical protein